MFAIAPASGPANLTAPQRRFLSGKSRWVRAMFEAAVPTIPTIVLTRAAWRELQAERQQNESRLRAHWVATLFRLVGSDGKPPALAVRTSTDGRLAGHLPARTNLPAPATETDAVDPKMPLGRAIDEAFDAYGDADDTVVMVQTMAAGDVMQFLSRDALSGEMGPAPLQGGGRYPDLARCGSPLRSDRPRCRPPHADHRIAR
jgi:pyruvate,orthophosphate dikinase